MFFAGSTPILWRKTSCEKPFYPQSGLWRHPNTAIPRSLLDHPPKSQTPPTPSMHATGRGHLPLGILFQPHRAADLPTFCDTLEIPVPKLPDWDLVSTSPHLPTVWQKVSPAKRSRGPDTPRKATKYRNGLTAWGSNPCCIYSLNWYLIVDHGSILHNGIFIVPICPVVSLVLRYGLSLDETWERSALSSLMPST